MTRLLRFLARRRDARLYRAVTRVPVPEEVRRRAAARQQLSRELDVDYPDFP